MSTPTPAFDSYQQVFALSMLSNKVAALSGTPAALQQQLLYELSPFLTIPSSVTPVTGVSPAFYTAPMQSALEQIGSWKLEWGPAVYQAKPSGNYLPVADNSIFVASNGSFLWPDGSTRTVYVVAIAATNFSSAYDWLTEDGDVSSVVEFSQLTKVGFLKYDQQVTFNPYVTPTAATTILPVNSYLSMGTATGVANLLSLIPTQDTSPSTVSLQDFLAGIAASPSNGLIFTGHSLAGALAPATAAYLQTVLPNFKNQILVYPTAGATPGSLVFANYFNSHFPQPTPGSLPYQKWNTDLWNYYDVVPHAWGTAPLYTGQNSLPNIPGIYCTNGATPLQDVGYLVDAAMANSLDSLVAYTPIQNSPLNAATPSPLQPCCYVNAPTPPQPGITGGPVLAAGAAGYSIDDFILQLVVQHVSMYMGIPPITYYPTGSTTTATQPAVNGLILQSGMPQATPALGLLSSVSPVTFAEMKTDIDNWINNFVANWIKNHL